METNLQLKYSIVRKKDQVLRQVEEISGKPLQLNRYGIDWSKVVLSPIHALQYADRIKGAS